jgi:microcystin-dependent protein
MPSTYSTSLRLELIGNGEQAANWGNTTNTNLGTLLEQAITGVSTVSFPADADRTLTSSNGVSDESRNAVLVLTSAVNLTATRNLIVPTVNKFYAIRNTTSGSQSVVVKTSAGTGVTLANGYTQLMYCDGTNVVLASVPISAADGSASVSGNLAVAGTITTGGGLVMPAGAMLEYGGASAPTGWLLCNGAAVSRTTYAALFAVLGTIYGAGDGSTTFNVPNKIDRVGVGAGSSYARGATGGAASATTSSDGSHNHTGAVTGTAISTAQMPSHTHGVNDPGHAHTVYSKPNSIQGFTPGGDGAWTGVEDQATSYSGTGISINYEGGNQAHNHGIYTDGTHTHSVSTIQPYLASNYIIKT